MTTTTLRPSGRPGGAAPEPLLRRLIGSVLRTRREAQGRTLRDVAASAQVSLAYLSEVERGRKEASSEVLVAICRALGMQLVDLVGEAHDALTERSRRTAVVVDLAASRRADLAPARPAEPATPPVATLLAA